MIFKNVVIGAALDAVNRCFVTQDAAHQNERQLAIACPHRSQNIHARPSREAIVRNYRIEGFRGDSLRQLNPVFNMGVGETQARARKLQQQQGQIAGGILGDEQPERVLGVGGRWLANGFFVHTETKSPSEPTRRPDSTESRNSENTCASELFHVSPVTAKRSVPGYAQTSSSLASCRSSRCRTMPAPASVLSTAKTANCASPIRARVSLRRKQSVSVAVNS